MSVSKVTKIFYDYGYVKFANNLPNYIKSKVIEFSSSRNGLAFLDRRFSASSRELVTLLPLFNLQMLVSDSLVAAVAHL
jgi:hypothetical protein